MDFALFLTILSVLLSVVFGLNIFKSQRYPGKVSLVKQTSISLFNNILKNFDNISMNYSGEPIKENIIYLKAVLINDGNKDIEPTSVEKPIKLELNEDLRWKEIKISNKTKGLYHKLEILNEGKEVEFTLGLFKKKEYIQFEALIETNLYKNKYENVFDIVKPTHRISNTQNIQKSTVLTEDQIQIFRSRFNLKIKLYTILLLIPFMLILLGPETVKHTSYSGDVELFPIERYIVREEVEHLKVNLWNN